MQHDDKVSGAAFSKDGKLILSWSDDGTVRLWHTKDGSPAAKPMTHKKRLKGARFSKDENLILTWSYDGTVRLWSAKDGSPIAEPMNHADWVNGATFNKDDNMILSWSRDGTVILWDISADYDFPKKHLPLLVEVITGTKMDDYGNISALSADEWNVKKQKYIEIAEKHLKDCKYKNANLYLKQREIWGRN